MKIVVVSTSEEYRIMLAETLADAGYQALLAADSQAAFDLICHEQPRLVLLDLWLEHPQAGEMLVGMLRVVPATRATPVIACTTDPHRMREPGALLQDGRCALLLKPVAIEDLLTTMTGLTQAEGDRSPIVQHHGDGDVPT